jgi:hypothetical protein
VPKNKLPPEVIKHWPEIFSDVEIKAIPIEYINSVFVHFHDGKVWEINVDNEKEEVEKLEHSLETFLAQYDNEISHVDFRLNTTQVVNDVKKRTQKFLKKRK